jgi:hypothetical protein
MLDERKWKPTIPLSVPREGNVDLSKRRDVAMKRGGSDITLLMAFPERGLSHKSLRRPYR